MIKWLRKNLTMLLFIIFHMYHLRTISKRHFHIWQLNFPAHFLSLLLPHVKQKSKHKITKIEEKKTFSRFWVLQVQEFDRISVHNFNIVLYFRGNWISKEKKMGRKEGQRTKGNTKVWLMSHNFPSYFSNLLISKLLDISKFSFNYLIYSIFVVITSKLIW